MYPPVNLQKAYNENEHLVISEEVGNNGLWLPSSINLSIDDIEYVCQKIIEFYSNGD